MSLSSLIVSIFSQHMFLRHYHPDIDIPFEIIKDEVEADEKLRRPKRGGAEADPYAGEQLAFGLYHTNTARPQAMLAWPSGKNKEDLSESERCNIPAGSVQMTDESLPVVSRFQTRNIPTGKIPKLIPSVTPVHSFKTPIQQIVVPALTPEEVGKRECGLICTILHSLTELCTFT